MIKLRGRKGEKVTKPVRGTPGVQIQVCLAPKLMHYLLGDTSHCLPSLLLWFEGIERRQAYLGEGKLAVQLAPSSDQPYFPLAGISV